MSYDKNALAAIYKPMTAEQMVAAVLDDDEGEPTDPYAAYRAKEAENTKREGRGLGFNEFGFVVSVPADALSAAALDMKPGGVVRVPATSRFADVLVYGDPAEIGPYIREEGIDPTRAFAVYDPHEPLWGVDFYSDVRVHVLPTGNEFDARLVADKLTKRGLLVSMRMPVPNPPAMSDLPDADFRAAVENYTAKTIADHDAWLRSIGWMAGDATAEVYGFGERADPQPEPAKHIAPPTHPAAHIRIVEDREQRMGCGAWQDRP